MATDIISCIKSFVAVAELGSFTQASRQMYLSTSVVTKQIQTLEHELNAILLTRTTRSLCLTNSGQTYLEKAKQILNTLQDGYNAVHNISYEPSGQVKIALPGFLQQGKFLGFLANFLKQYPKISTSITNNMSPFKLFDKSADVVISEFKINTPQFSRHTLLKVEKNVFASPTYLKKYGIPKTVDDLKNHNCLIHEIATPTHEWVFANDTRVQVTGNYTVVAGVNIVPAAVAGIGLTWVPNILVKNQLEKGELIKVNIEPGTFLEPVYLYNLPVAYTGLIKLLIDWIKKEISTNVWHEK